MSDEMITVKRTELEEVVHEAIGKKFTELELKMWRWAYPAIILMLLGSGAGTYYTAKNKVENFIERNSLIANNVSKKASNDFDLAASATDMVDPDLGADIRLRSGSELLVSVNSNIVILKKEDVPSSDINMTVTVEIYTNDNPDEPIAGKTDKVALQSSGFENRNMAEILPFSYNWVFAASELGTKKTENVETYKIKFKVVSNATNGGIRLASGRQLVAQELLRK